MDKRKFTIPERALRFAEERLNCGETYYQLRQKWLREFKEYKNERIQNHKRKLSHNTESPISELHNRHGRDSRQQMTVREGQQSLLRELQGDENDRWHLEWKELLEEERKLQTLSLEVRRDWWENGNHREERLQMLREARQKLLEREEHEQLSTRIRAVENVLKNHRFASESDILPKEDEEVTDMASYLVEKLTACNPKPDMASTLCRSCSQIPIMWLLERPINSYLLFHTIEELQKSVGACKLCHLILYSIGNYGSDQYEIHIAASPQFLVIELVRSNVAIVSYHLLQLWTDPGSDAEKMCVEVGRSIHANADQSSHYLILNEWLHDCDTHHTDHKFALDIGCFPELPKRVLEVKDIGDEKVRLHVPEKNTSESGRYIALSHCWGADEQHKKPLSNTGDNIEDLKNGIYFKDLPPLFQDAVKVTRELNIPYLWIDSLCIIQPNDNDNEDWIKESKKMGTIFANAYCTIAATSAKNSWEHFLTSRRVALPVKLPGNIYIAGTGRSFNEDLEKGELNRRGWVFQERALSRRTIHFTESQTYWECGSVIRCENLVQMAKPTGLLSSSQFPRIVSGSPFGGPAFAFEYIFSEFSKLGLQEKKDREYAILGLQSKLEEFYKTKALNGVVHCCFLKSILWQRSGGDYMEKISELDALPSWSWMRLWGPIRYGKFPKTGVIWNRQIIFNSLYDSHSGDENYGEFKAQIVKLSPDLEIKLWKDNEYKITKEGSFVGWMKFDTEHEAKIGDLGCIVVAHYKLNNWTQSKQFTWENFAWEDHKIPKNSNLILTNPSYGLIVSQVASEKLDFTDCLSQPHIPSIPHTHTSSCSPPTMSASLGIGAVLSTLIALYLFTKFFIHPLLLSPLSRIPAAHPTAGFSGLWISYQRYVGREVRSIHDAHRRLGPVVRLGQNEISVNSVEGVRVVYTFDKPVWYKRAFDNYGVPNMFSILKKKPHSERKKILANFYSKTMLFSSLPVASISQTIVVDRFLPIVHSSAISSRPINIEEIFLSFAIDFVSAYLFGTAAGTNFLNDEVERKRWLALHHKSKGGGFWKTGYPGIMKFLERIGINLVPQEVQDAGVEVKEICFRMMERLENLKERVPMSKSTLSIGKSEKEEKEEERQNEKMKEDEARSSKETPSRGSPPVLYDQLAAHFYLTSTLSDKLSPEIKKSSQKHHNLAIASELMDHIMAGTETIGWSLTYIVHELSKRPELQAELRKELRSIAAPFYFPQTTRTFSTVNSSSSSRYPRSSDPSPISATTGIAPTTMTTPTPRSLDTLPLLSAVINETLRLHPPVPGPQPRITPSSNNNKSGTTANVTISGYDIPGGIRVSAQAYSLHRNESVFPAPEEWHPERWLETSAEQETAMQRWFWAFGSGGRMCVGKDFALIELKLVIAAIYTNYTTSIIDDEGIEMLDGYSAGPKGDKLIVQFGLA
ncbi:hypothetical protein B7463_g7689, partial [Scytalidium lignicola]